MMKRAFVSAVALSAVLAFPAAAQDLSRVSIEPYAAYGFFGELPGETADGTTLEADVAYGGRVAYRLSPQWAVFGNYQRSTPEAEGPLGGEATVDHWAGGVEFSYVPRGGAQGMLPIILEAGVGQARYDYDESLLLGNNDDIAAKLGISSVLQLTPNLAVRYGVDDYISNYRDEEIVNQIFARAGVEISF